MVYSSFEMHRGVVAKEERAKRVKGPPNEKIFEEVVLSVCNDDLNPKHLR